MQNGFITLVGFAAGSLTTVSFLPQVIHVFKHRRADDISMSMYVIMMGGSMLWCVYGGFLHSIPIMVFNSAVFALAAMVLWAKRRFTRA